MWKVSWVLGVLASVAYAQPAKPRVAIDRVLVLGVAPEKRVTEIVEASRPALLACFDTALAADPSLTGHRDMVVVTVLDGEGAVTRHDVIMPSPQAQNAGLKSCIRMESAKWRFPTSTDGGTLEVEIHLELESGRPVPTAPVVSAPAPAVSAPAPARPTGGASIGSGTFGELGHHSIPKVTGALEREQVELGLRHVEATVSRCYTKALGHEPWGSDDGIVKLTISGKGKVTKILAARLDAPVERCLKKALKAIKFPASRNGKAVTMIYPVAPRDAGFEQIDPTLPN